MHDITQATSEEIMLELPRDAASDQSGVKAGFYRAKSGQQKKLNGRVRARVVRVYDPNNYAPIGGTSRFIPAAEEVVVKVDVFRDEGLCRDCRGSGHSGSTCLECGGTRVWWVDAEGARDKRTSSNRASLKSIECAACKCSTYDSPFQRASGYVACLACRGTGQRVGESGITLAAQYESIPTTGVILAIGKDVNRWQRGQRILFDTFTGKEYEFEGRKYRIIKQMYPLGQIIGNDDIHVSDAARSLMP